MPRHQQIVARILGNDYSKILTFIIGLSEIGMAIWILSGKYPRLNAVTQMFIVASMNALEFFLAPDLLLWGKANAIFALMFIVLIYYNDFYIRKKIALQK